MLGQDGLGPAPDLWQEEDFLCMGVSASLGLTPQLSASHGWMVYSAAEAPQAGPVQGSPGPGSKERRGTLICLVPPAWPYTESLLCRSLLLRVLHWHLDLRAVPFWSTHFCTLSLGLPAAQALKPWAGTALSTLVSQSNSGFSCPQSIVTVAVLQAGPG